MELRDLRYYLSIAHHRSLSEAAKSLHLTQPALTRSLKALEEELGKQLVIRGSRRIMLTEDGELLLHRAEELLTMADKTVAEIRTPEHVIAGDISICGGETKALHYVTQAFKRLMDRHPGIRLNISSGDISDVLYRLETGLADFGLIFPPFDTEKYASIRIPYANLWGLNMRKDDPLAGKAYLEPKDLIGQPLIVPREIMEKGNLENLLSLAPDQIRIVGTYSLVFNGSLMVTDRIGYLLCLDQILNLSGDTVQCFRPLRPEVTQNIHICWKRYAPLSRQASVLLEEMRRYEYAQVQYLFDPL